jgi:hypothetical protein
MKTSVSINVYSVKYNKSQKFYKNNKIEHKNKYPGILFFTSGAHRNGHNPCHSDSKTERDIADISQLSPPEMWRMSKLNVELGTYGLHILKTK